MARPIKVGLDYFPLDVTLEDKIELLEAECGLVGFAVLIKLWQKIYSNGYYIEWTEDNAMLFSRKINSELIVVNNVINVCFKRCLLNKELFDKYNILTSKGIQERYFKVCADSKRKSISVIKEHLIVNSELLPVNSVITHINSEFSTQRKEEERKEEKNLPDDSIDIIIEHHKSLANLPKFQKITDARKKSINARISDYGVEKVKDVLFKANNSDFLNKKEKWYDFDWIYNPNNFIKILECKFDNKQMSNNNKSQASNYSNGFNDYYEED